MNTADKFEIQIEDLPEKFREIAEAIGMPAAMALVQTCGGDEIYVPKHDRISTEARNRQIRAEHRAGDDYRSLARRYNLTTVHIRSIIGAKGLKTGTDAFDKQISLF
jgi:Mor family transcriptional regulator